MPPIRTLARRVWAHDLGRALVAGAAVAAVVIAAAVLLISGLRDASSAVADVEQRRETLQELEREATRIEISGWRIWGSQGRFVLEPQTALRALALVEQTRRFYLERVERGSREEAALAQRALALLESVPQLIEVGGDEESTPAGLSGALEQFPEFTEEQENIHDEWLALNARQVAAAERRRDAWAWAGIIALALLAVAFGVLAVLLLRYNARLQRATIEQLRRQAVTDDLTGLVNQGEFHRRLAAAVERAHALSEPLSVIVLDVDHFKRVNDAHGHQVGDRVLAEIGRRILGAARAEDCVARVGGEEFAWILPGVAEPDAGEAARRARCAVAAEPVIGVGALTVSGGVAALEPGLDAVSLYRRADMALYRAKQRGRDAVVRHGVAARPGRRPPALSPG